VTPDQPSANATPKVLDGMWTSFRQIYLDASGRIIDTGNGGVSHTEGQGYGMLLAAAVGDRAAFEAMYNWTQSHLARGDMALYSWRFDPRSNNPVADPNNATDGDMLIALALARGARRWRGRVGDPFAPDPSGDPRKAGDRARWATLSDARHHGFDLGDRLMINPRYFIFPALDAFAQLDGAGTWGRSSPHARISCARPASAPLACPPTGSWWAMTACRSPRPTRRRNSVSMRCASALCRGGQAGPSGHADCRLLAQQAGVRATNPGVGRCISGAEAGFPLSPGGINIVQRTLNQPLKTEALAQDYYGRSAIAGAAIALNPCGAGVSSTSLR
jgi:endoglucanase